MSDYTVYKVIFILKKKLNSVCVSGGGSKFDTFFLCVKKISQGTLNLQGIPLSSALHVETLRASFLTDVLHPKCLDLRYLALCTTETKGPFKPV